jgi:hypothetical protein
LSIFLSVFSARCCAAHPRQEDRAAQADPIMVFGKRLWGQPEEGMLDFLAGTSAFERFQNMRCQGVFVLAVC